ncbi:MAG: HAD family phosphatase [Clostridia bacterium]|nr:HAD family phosphatase [Clostridia bacterium]
MKLIITDLDGTLLRSDNTISEYTVRVLEKVKAKGHMIGFASARGFSMTRYVDLIKPHITIKNGGAKISFNGDIIYRNMLSENDVSKIIRMCREFSNAKALICVENDEGYFCNYVPDDIDGRAVYTYSDLSNFEGLAYDISSELVKDEWVTEIQKSCANCNVQSFTGMSWRQFSANNTSKESALIKLITHIGIKLDDVIAFGDDINDLGMLKIAGKAVAVSNAIDEVKAVADHITESNDQDGVAIYLEKTILRNE